jgi:UDP-2,4-diacetamido-2,4,6-trideoxy-beta-L-altropyranose hydrolase
MKIAFRADASITIGTGHVMRCLTLADRLQEDGVSARFLCRPLDGHLGERITARGHDLAWLPVRESLARDAEDSLEALADEAPWDWLVVDHYGLDAAWERVMRGAAKKVMAIDDLADRTHDCDLLLDQNLQEPGRYSGLVPDACQILIGPRYALLRPQFAAARQGLRPREGKVKRLLVLFGGTDAGGATLKALAAIQLLGRPDLAVDVVVGQANPHRAAIEAACRALPGATLHCQVGDMASLMTAADLFVGAGGTSSWERCCLGLPALVISIADNQIAQSVALAEAGVHRYLGPASSVVTHRLAREISSLMLQLDLLQNMALRGKDLVDGLGAERIRKCMHS